MRRTGIKSSEDLARALEFLGWLRLYDPNIRIPGSIPSIKLQELVLEFCKEKGYSNGKSLSNEINKWLMGKGPFGILLPIYKFLEKINWQKSLDWEYEEYNPFDRYNSVKFHALFLFMSSNNFQSSMEAHWRDLNYLTGDDLEIYFSQEDLKRRVSGYKITNALSHLQLRVDILPALLLWEDRLETNTMISLQGLDPERVVEVMKTIVQAIRDGCTLKVITERGEHCSRELKKELEDKSLAREGSIKMTHIYTFNGEIHNSIIGPGKNSKNKIVNEILLDRMLTPEEVCMINEIKDALEDMDIEGIEEKERHTGASHLSNVAEAKNKKDQEESLAGWKKWLDSLGERGQKALSVLANTMTIAIPIATLLGIYPS
jgi:hypothetical protein